MNWHLALTNVTQQRKQHMKIIQMMLIILSSSVNVVILKPELLSHLLYIL